MAASDIRQKRHAQQMLFRAELRATDTDKRRVIVGAGRDQYIAFQPVVKYKHSKSETWEKSKAIHDGKTYEIGPHDLRRYKSVKTAIANNHSHKYSLTGKQAEGNPLVVNPLVVIFRPDELEPVNVSPDERIRFYLDQIDTWTKRLFESGLSADEMAVIAEDLMLELGKRMKQYKSAEVL